MTVRIKAHFDGKMIVPDEPVDLPVGTAVTVEATLSPKTSVSPTVEARLAAVRRIAGRATRGTPIPDEAFRRENMYGDDGR
jgi:hypothetical protein